MKKCWISLLLVSCLSGKAVGQNYSTSLYTTRDGLPGVNFNAIMEDQHGYLWLGAVGRELIRFDGKQFDTYEISDSLEGTQIQALSESKSHGLLVGTTTGLYTFLNYQFTRLVDPHSESKRFVKRFIEVGDSTYMLFSNSSMGLIRSDTIIWELPREMQAIQAFKYNNDLLIVKDLHLKMFRSGKLLYSIAISNHFSTIHKVISFHGYDLLATNKGLFRIEKDKTILNLYPEISDRVVVYSQSDSTFWIASNFGLSQAKLKRGKVEFKPFLGSNYRIRTAIGDTEQINWFLSENLGLIKVMRKKFKKIFPSGNARLTIGFITRIDNALWLGTVNDGVVILKNDEFVRKLTFPRPYQNMVRSIRKIGSHVFFGTYGGLVRLDQNTGEIKTWTRSEGLTSDSVFSLLPGTGNSIWIGTLGGGLIHKENSQLTRYPLPDQSQDYYVWSLQNINGILYAATNRGLYKIADNKLTQVVSVQGENVWSIEGCGSDAVFSLSKGDSMLVIGTNTRGIGLINTENRSIRFLRKSDGLLSDVVYKTSVDRRGFLWLNTNRGIQRLKLNGNYEIVDARIFDSEIGFEGIEANIVSTQMIDDEILLGSVSGLYRFNENDSSGQSFDHNFHFSSVKLYYGEKPLHSFSDNMQGIYAIPKGLTLPSEQNHLTFGFKRVSKSSAEHIRYRYKLEGFDSRWSEPSSNDQVTYGNIPPGSYVLIVQATMTNGLWGKDLIRFPFQIDVPFYLSWMFMSSTIVLIGMLIFALIYFRIKYRVAKLLQIEAIRQEEQVRLRKEIARDFHDEIGNKLAKVINYIGLIKLGHSSEKYLGKIEEMAKATLLGTRDFVWSVNPENDEWTNLFIKLKDFGEKLFEDARIDFRTRNNLQHEVTIQPGATREILLIFKEAMTNVLKHSKANTVVLELTEEGNLIRLGCKDNGVGFEKLNSDVGNGLSNMRIRAAKIDAEIEIQSNYGEGTHVILTMK